MRRLRFNWCTASRRREWISVEYINGGVDPETREFSPGSVLSFLNTQSAWEQARALDKPLRFSFGRADREYKDRWCNPVPVLHRMSQPMSRKQQLLKRHRRNKRIGLLIALVLLIAVRRAGGLVVAAGAGGAGLGGP